jgi:lipoyl(octanoyl) transferase
MMRAMERRSLGTISYPDAWNLQHSLVEERALEKISDTILVLEHPHVITFGRKTPGVIPMEESGQKDWQGVPLFIVERGGEATYHGPGQIVLYPIFRLPEKMGPKHFLRVLEKSIIQCLADFGIKSHFKEGATGVWLTDNEGREKKIASLGISVRKGVSYHGLALNIATELSYFSKIRPCGFASDVMTSMEECLGKKIDSQRVSDYLVEAVHKNFQEAKDGMA